MTSLVSASIPDSIRQLLDETGVRHREVHHGPTRTSEESARARGEDIRVGGKPLLMKIGDAFRLLVLIAALRVDSAAIRQHLDERKSRFATVDELRELTGLVPGNVPPFDRPILPLDLFVDNSVTRNERIAFNAGSLTPACESERHPCSCSCLESNPFSCKESPTHAPLIA